MLASGISVGAGLKEIGRVGPTESADKYFENVSFTKGSFKNNSFDNIGFTSNSSTNNSFEKISIDRKKVSGILAAARKSITRNLFFPLKPRFMKPGFLKERRFDPGKVISPFAVAGTDKLSLKWLDIRKEKLEELNSPVYIIEANSFEVIQRLASRFKGLKFVPSSGDSLGKELKIENYPFLVTSSGLWQ